MRQVRIAILIAALSLCVGASECSGSGSSGGNRASAEIGTGVDDGLGSEGGGSSTAPVPEPGGALLFALGALIAARATRRLETPRS